ncbi:hypothetical protein R5R35_005141 [Gryllus longicercus]|uniref:Ras-related protein Rab-28 n=1 Tax=Gryllus longicercus TaxID=2509291 RepID=A0AAN9V9J0_9ORTH
MSDSENETTETQLKIVILGECACGKTSIASRYCHDEFVRQYYPTSGVDFFLKKTMLSGGRNVTLQIWDVAGHALSGNMLDKYVFGANIVFLVFDITNITSFEKLEHWLNAVRHFTTTQQRKPAIIVVGNKCDLEHQRQVRPDKQNRFIQENGLVCHLVSARTGEMRPSVSDLKFLGEHAKTPGLHDLFVAAVEDTSVMAHCSTEEGAGAETGGLSAELLAVMLPRVLLVAHWNHPHTCAAWGCRRTELGACSHAHGPLTKEHLRRLDAACPGCSFVAAHNSQVAEFALRRLDEEERAAAEGAGAQAPLEAAAPEIPASDDSWQKRVASFQPHHICSKWKLSTTSRKDALENYCVANVDEEGSCCKGSCSPQVQNFLALRSKIPVSPDYNSEEIKDANDPPCPGCYVFQAHEEFMNFYLEDSVDIPQKGNIKTSEDGQNSGKRNASNNDDVEFLLILAQQMMMLNPLNLFYDEDDDEDDDEYFLECRHRSAG